MRSMSGRRCTAMMMNSSTACVVTIVLSCVAAPAAATGIRAPYPDQALVDCLEGSATLGFKTDENGNAIDIVVTRSEPTGVFDQAAIKLLRMLSLPPSQPYQERTYNYHLDGIEECRARLACDQFEAAHERMRNSCFVTQRQLTITLNGQETKSETARINYRDGSADIDVLESSVSDERIQLDSEKFDAVGMISYACERLSVVDDGLFELVGEEDPETLRFELTEDGDLVPLSWHFATVERFLFKKYRLLARADYSDVQYHDCPLP